LPRILIPFGLPQKAPERFYSPMKSRLPVPREAVFTSLLGRRPCIPFWMELCFVIVSLLSEGRLFSPRSLLSMNRIGRSEGPSLLLNGKPSPSHVASFPPPKRLLPPPLINKFFLLSFNPPLFFFSIPPWGFSLRQPHWVWGFGTYFCPRWDVFHCSPAGMGTVCSAPGRGAATFSAALHLPFPFLFSSAADHHATRPCD